MGRPKRQMLIGGTMVVVGWLAIFAMVLELIPRPIELYMAAYIVSLIGFGIGMFGVATVVRENLRRHRNDDDEYHE